MNKQLKEYLINWEKTNKSISKIQSNIDNIRWHTLIPCSKCNKKMHVYEMDMYRIFWKSIVAEYQYICCHCKYVNRILFKVQGDHYREYMTRLASDYFKHQPMKDVWYDENEPAKRCKFINNFYFEKLIDEEKAFEEKQNGK